MQASDILTVEAAAEAIGVDPSLVRRWIRQQRLPAKLHGERSYLVARIAVDALAETPRKRGTSVSLPKSIIERSRKILGIS
jgi:excisionase family DNA binding protein